METNNQFWNSPTVSKEGKDLLQSRFQEQEVLGCLKMCAMDKALGLMILQWDPLSDVGRCSSRTSLGVSQLPLSLISQA